MFKRFLSVFYYSYLVLYPFFSALSGLVLFLAGLFTWVFLSHLNVESRHDDALLASSVGFIIIGITLTIVPFILCCAITTRKYWITTLYVGITLMLLVTEMTFGVYLSLVPERATNKTRISLGAMFDNSSFNSTDSYSRARANVDMIQLRFHCCGVDGPEYWKERNISILPRSCCDDFGQNATCTETNSWRDGCVQRSVALVSDTSRLLFRIIIFIAAVKMIGILFFVIRHDWNGELSEESASLMHTDNR